jgi:hypothetical protein
LAVSRDGISAVSSNSNAWSESVEDGMVKYFQVECLWGSVQRLPKISSRGTEELTLGSWFQCFSHIRRLPDLGRYDQLVIYEMREQKRGTKNSQKTCGRRLMQSKTRYDHCILAKRRRRRTWTSPDNDEHKLLWQRRVGGPEYRLSDLTIGMECADHTWKKKHVNPPMRTLQEPRSQHRRILFRNAPDHGSPIVLRRIKKQQTFCWRLVGRRICLNKLNGAKTIADSVMTQCPLMGNPNDYYWALLTYDWVISTTTRRPTSESSFSDLWAEAGSPSPAEMSASKAWQDCVQYIAGESTIWWAW